MQHNWYVASGVRLVAHSYVSVHCGLACQTERRRCPLEKLVLCVRAGSHGPTDKFDLACAALPVSIAVEKLAFHCVVEFGLAVEHNFAHGIAPGAAKEMIIRSTAQSSIDAHARSRVLRREASVQGSSV